MVDGEDVVVTFSLELLNTGFSISDKRTIILLSPSPFLKPPQYVTTAGFSRLTSIKRDMLDVVTH